MATNWRSGRLNWFVLFCIVRASVFDAFVVKKQIAPCPSRARFVKNAILRTKCVLPYPAQHRVDWKGNYQILVEDNPLSNLCQLGGVLSHSYTDEKPCGVGWGMFCTQNCQLGFILFPAVTGKQVNLEMVAGVFIVLAVGLLLSFGVLGVEIMWHQRNRENLGWVIELLRWWVSYRVYLSVLMYMFVCVELLYHVWLR